LQEARVLPDRRERSTHRRHGFEVGKPIVQNMSFGRAKFGFEGSGSPPSATQTRADHICEQRVDMARKISRIIAEDRRTTHPGGL